MKYKFEKPIGGTIGIEKYQMTITWRNGQFIADEPMSSGGKDTGPDPFTLLLASLASCTLATLRMYIDQKGWDIAEISIHVNMFQQDKDGNMLTVIDKDLRFASSTTEEQRQRLIEIAERCPVSKILKGDIAIRNYIFNDEDTEKKVNYSNEEITVEWRPDVCKHSGRCISGLPEVFDKNKHPWVNMKGAEAPAIIDQVSKCPTGALRIHYNTKLI